jgi:hypothetical protein
MTAISPTDFPQPSFLSRIGSAVFGDNGLDFLDVLDLVNPLQHIPVVSTLYRSLTGDQISPGMRVAGGALYGGPIGAGLATAGLVVENAVRGAAPEVAVAVRALHGGEGGWLLRPTRCPMLWPHGRRGRSRRESELPDRASAHSGSSRDALLEVRHDLGGDLLHDFARRPNRLNRDLVHAGVAHCFNHA